MMLDRKDAYGWLSIALHWIAAAFVIALFLLGERIEDAPDRDSAIAAMGVHISVGAIAWSFLVLRVALRLIQGHPAPMPQHVALKLLSYVVQYGLLLVIAIQVVTGPLAVWSNGFPVRVFDWFAIPSPLERNHDLHELCETIHVTTAKLVLPLIALHVLGAVKHLVIDRDRTLQRILWVRRSS